MTLSNIISASTRARLANLRTDVVRPSTLVARRGEEGDLYLYGIIGFEEFGGLSAASVVGDLRKLDGCKQINVYLNSPGGDVFEGLTIYNQLLRHPAQKRVVVDGEAASIASVIAMAGDRIVMAPESTMMIHEARVFAAAGTAEQLRKTADDIERSSASIRDIYGRRTKQTAERLTELMAAETTMTAEQAVAMGFADEVESPQAAPAPAARRTALKPFTQLQLAQLMARRGR